MHNKDVDFSATSFPSFIDSASGSEQTPQHV
jgi:hypothetical protein